MKPDSFFEALSTNNHLRELSFEEVEFPEDSSSQMVLTKLDAKNQYWYKNLKFWTEVGPVVIHRSAALCIEQIGEILEFANARF
jgi:hypothetical protein